MHRTFETPQPGGSSSEDLSWWEGVHSYFHLTDVQFSTVAILDEAGRLLERTRYQVYGQGLHQWPGDFNGDGHVDSSDGDELAAAAENSAAIDNEYYDPDMDLDRNGVIDGKDGDLFNLWSGRGPVAAGLISDPDGPDNTIGYSGYVLNPEALIYTVRHRHYEPMLGRFMEEDWLGYVDGMNLYEYVGGMAPNAVDPSGLKSDRHGRSRDRVLNQLNQDYCGAITDARDKGKMCQDQFEQQWTNHNCGDPRFDVTAAERQAWRVGFIQGAHDGYIQTAFSTANAFTLGLFNLNELPTDMGWLYDPDNPYLKVSRVAGVVAASALHGAIAVRTMFAFGATEARIGMTRFGHFGWAVQEQVVTNGGRVAIMNGYHASGKFFHMAVKSLPIGERGVIGKFGWLRGIPVINPGAAGASMVGQHANTCLTGVVRALLRGWNPFL